MSLKNNYGIHFWCLSFASRQKNSRIDFERILSKLDVKVSVSTTPDGVSGPRERPTVLHLWEGRRSGRWWNYAIFFFLLITIGSDISRNRNTVVDSPVRCLKTTRGHGSRRVFPWPFTLGVSERLVLGEGSREDEFEYFSAWRTVQRRLRVCNNDCRGDLHDKVR